MLLFDTVCFYVFCYRFCGVFPSVQTALKKRDQSLQDYNKAQTKYTKYQERERTGHNVVKLDSVSRGVSTSLIYNQFKG